MRPSQGSGVSLRSEAVDRSVTQPLSPESPVGSDVPADAASHTEPISPFATTVTRDRQSEATPAAVVSSGSSPVHVEKNADGTGGPKIPLYLKLLGAAFVAGLPALATLIGILFDLFPSLQQDPPPSVLSATFHEVRLEERGTDPNHDDASILIVSYDLEFTGYKSDFGYVNWALIDPVTLERLPITAWAEAPNLDDRPVEPEAPNDRLNETIEIPVPFEQQCVFARIYLYDAKVDSESRTRLDYADTAVFHTHDPKQSCEAAVSAPD